MEDNLGDLYSEYFDSGNTVTATSPAGQAASQTAGAGNSNGSGGQSVTSFIQTLGNLANTGLNTYNQVTGKKPVAPVAPKKNNTMLYLVGGAVVLVLLVVLGRR